MTLSLERPIASVDCETTGKDPVQDRVVQLGATVLHPDGRRVRANALINPGRPIPAEASAVHRIYDTDVVGLPSFEGVAPQFAEILRGVDITGHRVRPYDLVMLELEFHRCGMPVPWEGAHVVDTFDVHRKLYPGTLVDVHRLYCGRDFDGAHSAQADSEAALDVLLGQLRHAPSLPRTVPELAAFVTPDYVARQVDPTGKLERREDGVVVFSFGVHKDKALTDPIVPLRYLQWVESGAAQPFHPRVVAAVRGEMERRKATAAFGRTAAPARP